MPNRKRSSVGIMKAFMLVTCSPRNSPWEKRLLPFRMARQGRRRSREKESIQRRSDHRHPEGVGSRGGDGRTVPATRDCAGVFLPVEEQVRWLGTERGKAAAATGGGEPAAEAHRGRAGGRHPGVEGGGCKKVVSPQARREAVLVMQVEVELSQRRACGLDVTGEFC